MQRGQSFARRSSTSSLHQQSPREYNRQPDVPCWNGEAWALDDGLVLNLPIFDGCCEEFKRLLLREIRKKELEMAQQETWHDEVNNCLLTLETLPEDMLPPCKPSTIGEAMESGNYVCRGGDYETKLVVVLQGEVEKRVGEAPAGGRCVVRTLTRGDYEGITEFLGVGSEQRTCALRVSKDGSKVRYVERSCLNKLLEQTVDDDEQVPRWPKEVAYFQELSLDRIDSLRHQNSKELLSWKPAGDTPLEYLNLPGQDLFLIDNALGTSVSGPLPEGIEERYFFDGQSVILPEVAGDCCVMVLRGELEALVPLGCQGQCLPRPAKPRPDAPSSWLGDGRRPQRPRPLQGTQALSESRKSSKTVSSGKSAKTPPPVKKLQMVTLVASKKLKRAVQALKEAAEKGEIDLSEQTSTDYTWTWDDPRALDAINVLRKSSLLTPVGEKKAAEVDLHQNPPAPPPPPEPQAVFKPGSMVGTLALLGTPVVFAGAVRAKGPALVTVLHRNVLLEALRNQAERQLFMPVGVTSDELVGVLSKPKALNDGVTKDRLGPETGPPPHTASSGPAGPAAGTRSCWQSGKYRGRAGADAFDLVLVNALRNDVLIWEIIGGEPWRLLENFVRLFEPRWLLPNEVVVVDEEPDADFLVVIIHGSFIVSLEGAEIDRISEGVVRGAAQILNLSDWTCTISVDPNQQGEAMVQVLRRQRLLDCLARDPQPLDRLRKVESELQGAKNVDWHLFESIPFFKSVAFKPFLSRILKDADVRFFASGAPLALKGELASSMIVVLAGTCKGEQPETLFYVELHHGDWCYQNNVLGLNSSRPHDLLATTNVMVFIIHRHAMLNALADHRDAREAILGNETWRADPSCPCLDVLQVFEKVPAPVLRKLNKAALPRYFRQGSRIVASGTHIPNRDLLLIQRGTARVTILGIETRELGPGEFIGMLQYLDVPAPPGQAEITAVTACDILSIPSGPANEACEDEHFKDAMQLFKNAKDVLAGGEVKDAYGFIVPGQGAGGMQPDCIENSEVFRVCSTLFVSQIPSLVEDMSFWPGETLYKQGEEGTVMYFVAVGRVRMEVYGSKEKPAVETAGSVLGDLAVLGMVNYHTETAVAETHVWVRALHKKLLNRVLESFPEEERCLTNKAQRRASVLTYSD